MNWTPATPIRPATPILPALFSYSYVLPIFYPLCFDIHACNGGCTPPSVGFRPPIPTPYPLSPFFSYSCALFCAHQKLNPFVFKRFRTLWQKHPGWGVPMNRTARVALFLRASARVPAHDGRMPGGFLRRSAMGNKIRTWMVPALAGLALIYVQAAAAQQEPDWSKVQIKVTKVSGNIYMLEGQGGNIAASVGEDGIVI